VIDNLCFTYLPTYLTVVHVVRQATGQLSNLESYLDHIAYEVDNVEPALSADRESLSQQISEIQVGSHDSQS